MCCKKIAQATCEKLHLQCIFWPFGRAHQLQICGVIKFYGFKVIFSVVTCISSSMHCTEQLNVVSGFRLINSQGAAIVFENFCCVEILHFFDCLRNLFSDAIDSSDNADPLLPDSFNEIYRRKKLSEVTFRPVFL